jgi:hypothetical protein
MLDDDMFVERWMLDVGCWMLDVGWRVADGGWRVAILDHVDIMSTSPPIYGRELPF